MVSLRRHTQLRLCYGRTSIPRFCDIRPAPQNSSQAKPKILRLARLYDVTKPEENTTATGASAKIAVLALPVFATVRSEAGPSRRRLRSETGGNSLGDDVSQSSQVTLQSQVKHPREDVSLSSQVTLQSQVKHLGEDVSLSSQVKSLQTQVKDPGDDVSLSSQVKSLQNQVKDPGDDGPLSTQSKSSVHQVKGIGDDASLSSQVKTLDNQVKDPGDYIPISSQVNSLQSQVKDPGSQVKSLQSQAKDRDSCTLQLENKIDSLKATVNKLMEETMHQNAELNTEKVESKNQKEDSEMLEFDKLLLQTIEKLCGNVELMQQVDLVMGKPNQMQLSKVLQKVEKLREDLSRVD